MMNDFPEGLYIYLPLNMFLFFSYSGFPLFYKYQIPGFLKVFGPKLQVFSRFW